MEDENEEAEVLEELEDETLETDLGTELMPGDTGTKVEGVQQYFFCPET